MSSTTSTENSSSTSTALTLADQIAQILVSVIPALGPYGTAIDLAFNVVATVAPPVYAEIKTLVENIKAGSAPTAAQIAQLQTMIAALTNPDGYFGGPIPTAATAPAATPAVAAAAAAPVKIISLGGNLSD